MCVCWLPMYVCVCTCIQRPKIDFEMKDYTLKLYKTNKRKRSNEKAQETKTHWFTYSGIA